MTLHICRTLIISLSLKNPLHLFKPHSSSVISFFFFFSSSQSGRLKKPSTAVADYLINKHQFSPEAALKASSVVKYLKNPENCDSILSFFKESGFSKTHLEEVIKRRPNVLSANLDKTIKPKIKIFFDLGFSPIDVAELIASDPSILQRSVDKQLGPSILALKSVFGSNDGVSRVLKICGWFLKRDLKKIMMPNIEFLKSCGISELQMMTYMFNFPRFFLRKPESIRDYVKRVDEMGFDRKSKKFLGAIRVISSMSIENWELKLQHFQSLGFSEDDILSMFRRVPQVFDLSVRKITEATQVLISSGNVDISYLVNYPVLLTFSIEQRIKPRLRFLEILELKNLLPKKPSLTTICKISEKQFVDRYVLPYSNEVGELYMAREASWTNK